MTFDLILIGLAISLEPLPLIGYLLLLSSAGGAKKGVGFVVGWILTLAAIVIATVLLTSGKPLKSGSAPSDLALSIKIALGIVLLLVAYLQYQRRSRPKPRPSWMARIDRVGVGGATLLGVLLQPWPLVAAGAATVTAADLSTLPSVIALVGFCLLATGSYLCMQAYALLDPVRSGERLSAFQESLDRNRVTIIIAISVIVGCWLIAESVYLLLT